MCERDRQTDIERQRERERGEIGGERDTHEERRGEGWKAKENQRKKESAKPRMSRVAPER